MGVFPSVHITDVKGQTQVSMQMMNYAYAKEIGSFKKPSLKGYNYITQWYHDIDEDGNKESLVKLYKNSNGDSISILYKKGTSKVWSWSLDTTGDNDSDITKNYGIVDTDNDGKFDTRYNLSKDVPPPSWVE